MTQAEIQFRLDLPLMAKARPRFGRGHSYLPAKYRAWKDSARAELARIWDERQIPTLQRFELAVEAHGPGRSDADNLIGSLLDAGLPDKRSGWPGAWKDDRVTVIPSLCFHWIRDKEQFWLVNIVIFDT